MKRLIAVSAAAFAALSIGGAALANCADCQAQCDRWYDDPDQVAACKNGCAFACVGDP
jgi:hypothetical protein